MHDVEQQERDQLLEQDIAQCLIDEAASKLSAAVKSNDMQAAKVAQVMLDSGNDKLNETVKQLVDIRIRKDKIQTKLLNAQKTLADMKKHSANEQPSGPTPKDSNNHRPSLLGCAGKEHFLRKVLAQGVATLPLRA